MSYEHQNLHQYKSLGLQKLSEYCRFCICMVSILVGNRNSWSCLVQLNFVYSRSSLLSNAYVHGGVYACMHACYKNKYLSGHFNPEHGLSQLQSHMIPRNKAIIPLPQKQCQVHKSHALAHALQSSLVPRPFPAFQCCTLKSGMAWYLKSRA